jgi:hypothetical protein
MPWSACSRIVSKNALALIGTVPPAPGAGRVGVTVPASKAASTASCCSAESAVKRAPYVASAWSSTAP